MVWNAIWTEGRSNLVIMTRDEAAAKKGYTANSYLNVLKEQIPICYEPGRTFVQDNARIHTARIITNWFKENAVSVLDWPQQPGHTLQSSSTRKT